MIRNINQNINWFRENNGKKIYSCESATDVITIGYSPTFYFASTNDRETKHHVQLNAASSSLKLNSWYRNCIAICVEFLSKVRLRLISPTSEILSRLFSFFFFFLFEKTNRESFFLFTFSFLSFFFFSSAILPCYRDTSAFPGRIRDKLKVNNERAEIADSDCDAISFAIRGLCNSFGSKQVEF